MRKIFVNQDDDFVRALDDPYKALDHPLIYVGQMYPRVSQSSTELQWVQINSIPEFDKNGRLLGSFGIWRNINDIMQKQEQLKRETERANDSGHQKSVFLANMTHEIRTPLNAIVGFSDLLQAIDSPEEKREMIRIIHNNCDMLLRLVNDILVLSNVDANAMQMRPEQIDFVAEFNDICKSLAERVQEPTVQFQSESPCETHPCGLPSCGAPRSPRSLRLLRGHGCRHSRRPARSRLRTLCQTQRLHPGHGARPLHLQGHHRQV